MTLAKRSVGVLSTVLGMVCLFLGTMDVLGVQRHLVADRWQFFVRDEGVTDRPQALAIADRLAADAQRSGWLHLAAGLLLLVNAGLLLGWTRRPGAESSTP